MDTHRRAVLGTPELLEYILLQMDMRTLLAAQCVCRAWDDVITTVPSIRQKLFFQPAPHSNVAEKNPLLAELFPHWFAHGEWANRREMFAAKDLSTLAFVRKELNSAFQYEKASWKKMLLTQPPIRSFVCCQILYVMDGEGCDLSVISEQGETPYAHAGEQLPIPEAESTGNPLTMETFYRQVTKIYGTRSGDAYEWLFIWGDETSQQTIPGHLGRYTFQEEIKEELEVILRRDGLVMFEKANMACTDWRGDFFPREYHIDDGLVDFLREWDEVCEDELRKDGLRRSTS
ncbi:unnamed protein product [Clonostachys chloroleuca]|uniref:F-box domain-containing protein n=1 Tax=Clonostachys chloroleuca TaxID=1926264 RepID=A0AA35Q9C0_9HYPO|nr:unnamed protein product [Clonostachys chloroleuca]